MRDSRLSRVSRVQFAEFARVDFNRKAVFATFTYVRNTKKVLKSAILMKKVNYTAISRVSRFQHLLFSSFPRCLKVKRIISRILVLNATETIKKSWEFLTVFQSVSTQILQNSTDNCIQGLNKQPKSIFCIFHTQNLNVNA